MPATAALALRYNASLVEHEVLFASSLRAHMLGGVGMSEGEVGIALASFMRVDAALLAAAESLQQPVAWVRENLAASARGMAALGRVEDTVLYTDTDVLFLGPVGQAVVLGDVAFAGAFAVRRDSPRSSKFNPAVMLLRVSRFLLLYERLLQFWEGSGFACVRDAWDQGCLNAFVQHEALLEEVAVLPPELHTTPYDKWVEGNPPVLLLHFHGPKPQMLLEFLRGAGAGLDKSGYPGFVTLNPEGYLKSLMLFAALQDAPTAAAQVHGTVDASFLPWCKKHPGTVPC
jgi:hypothetical protein